jgi:hypothetical protein
LSILAGYKNRPLIFKNSLKIIGTSLKIIQDIREKFAKSYLLQQHQLLNRVQQPINLTSAHTVALLYYVSDEPTYKMAELILSQLTAMNMKVRVVCYTDLKIIPHYFIPKITQDIITAKDVNWRFQPVKTFVKEFINAEYDILIDLSLNDHLPLLYCSALSKAGLKVGRFQEDHRMFYDLMIHSLPDETIETFAEQVIYYLSRINT